MNNEMVRRACHAIGMDNKQPFYKYGEKHFISYRNYFVSNRLGDEYFDKMESEGLAESDRGKTVSYLLSDRKRIPMAGEGMQHGNPREKSSGKEISFKQIR